MRRHRAGTSVRRMDEQTDFDSLDDALERFGIPLENRAFVRRIPAQIPLSGFRRTTGYIRADRVDGGPRLSIAHGYTNGFVSKEEVISVFGDVDCWESSTRAPLWGVSHPLNKLRDGGDSKTGSSERDYGTCPVHFLKLSANLNCPVCD